MTHRLQRPLEVKMVIRSTYADGSYSELAADAEGARATLGPEAVLLGRCECGRLVVVECVVFVERHGDGGRGPPQQFVT